MKDQPNFRPAGLTDIDFITEAIISAEKSGTDKLSYSSVFELEETNVRQLLKQILQEDIPGSELSMSSFWVAEYDSHPVATSAVWIESFNNTQSSRIIKSNLLYSFFPKESVFAANSKAGLTKGIFIEREKGTIQLEYVYTAESHRNKGLQEKLIGFHVAIASSVEPAPAKMQVQVFKNNFPATKLYEKLGFKEVKCFIEKDTSVLKYFPFNEKLLMERLL